jgi:dTDP-4-amino-4,6-dideoxygalactose transaminase
MSGKNNIKIPLAVDLKREYKEIKKEIDKAIQRVIKSGWFLLGKELESFEKEFAHYLGVKYVCGVSSGTEALRLALLAVGIKEGDEVITVSHTFISSVYAIQWVGATPILVDIDKKTYCIDPQKIEAKITPRTRAILPVHLYGYPAAMDKIMAIARRYKLLVIEDSCQAHGSSLRGKKLGTIGDVGCFSFYPSKNMGCYGDGGAVVTNNQKIAKNVLLLRNYGESKKYHYQIKGFNARLAELQAAVLRVKLKYLDEWNRRRIKIAEIYNREFKDLPVILPPRNNSQIKGNYCVYAIRTNQRDKLQKYLRENNICSLIHYPIPIHLQGSCRELLRYAKELKITEEVAKSILSLPIFPQMKEKEISYICEKVKKFFR